MTGLLRTVNSYEGLLTSNSHLPHPREQLNQPTVRIRRSDYDRRHRDTTSIRIDQTQNKRRQGKRTEAQRRRVPELAEAGLVRCGLEGTTERRHPLLGRHLPVQWSSVSICTTIGYMVLGIRDVGGMGSRGVRLQVRLLGVGVSGRHIRY